MQSHSLWIQKILAVLVVGLLGQATARAQDEQQPIPDPSEIESGFESIPEATAEEEEALDTEEARQKRIDENYQETIGIYRGVLENDGVELQNFERRINANEKMLADYRAKREEAEVERRELNVGFDHQVLELREAAQRGEIAGDLLERLLEEKRRSRQLRDEELHSDIIFYTQEIERLGNISRELKSRHQVLKMSRRYGSEVPPADENPPAPPSVIDQIQEKYRRVSGFRSEPLMRHATRVEPWASELRGGPAARQASEVSRGPDSNRKR